jgi:hypothetical protein
LFAAQILSGGRDEKVVADGQVYSMRVVVPVQV